jgi:transcriptional regulator NrdR family protein
MICIKCSNETKVTNSRPHKKTPSVWRRRECKACGTVFTTSEVVADESYQFTIKAPDGSTSSFSLPRLMLSIAPSLSHRSHTGIADESYWLAQTVAQTIQATATDSITSESLAVQVYDTVSLFDATAGLQYGARHGLVQNTAQRPRRGRPRTSRRGIN